MSMNTRPLRRKRTICHAAVATTRVSDDDRRSQLRANSPPTTVARTPDTPRASADRYAAKGASSVTITAIAVSRICASSQPPARPTARGGGGGGGGGPGGGAEGSGGRPGGPGPGESPHAGAREKRWVAGPRS